MTKTIVLGEQPKTHINNPIEFFSVLGVMDSHDVDATIATTKPYHWKYIELVSKNYSPNIDLLFAYNDADKRAEGLLIIGRWNDGFVQQS